MTLHPGDTRLPGDSRLPGESQWPLDEDEEQREGALAFLRAGRAEAHLLSRVSSALKVARLHSLENAAARQVLDELHAALARFLTGRGMALVLLGEGKRVYVNGRLVRAGKSGGAWLEDVADTLERVGATALLLAGEWDLAAARQLMAAFAAPAPLGTTDRLVPLRAALTRIAAPAVVQVLDAGEAAALVREEEEGYLSESQRAAFYFARLLTLAEAAVRSVRAGRGPDVHGRQMRQTLMKIVDSLAHPVFEARLLACGALEPGDADPIAGHSARVAVLAIAMGRLLGLSRGNQADLGLAALHHDLGRIDATRKKSAHAEVEDPRSVESHLLRGVRHALRGRNYAASGLLRLVVALEHHRSADGVPEGAMLREPHVLTRVIAIADAFDRLEHGLPWRKPVGPAEALRTLSAEPDRFDPTVVELLSDAIGQTPRGTLLRLRSGEVAVVIAGGARLGHRPVLRRLLLATGAPDPVRSQGVLESPDDVVAELPPDVAVDWRAALLS